MMLVALTLFCPKAFADTGDVTTNADIDFSTAPVRGVITGTVNQTSISGTSYVDQEVLRTVDETNTVVIPEEQYAGRKDVVKISFDKAWGDKQNMGSGFRLVDAEGEYIATFQHARWDGKGQNANTLNIDMSGLVGAHNNHKPNYDRATHFEITVDYKQKLITTVVTCPNLNKTATFTAAMTNTNPIAKFEHFAYGVGGNTDRADSFDNLLITTTEGDYNVPTANYTVKYVCDGAEIKEADVRTSDVGESITLLDADKAKFKNEDGTKKYEYVSDDSEGATIAADGSTVVTVTFQEIPTFNYTVKAAIGDEEVVDLTEGTLFEDETTTVYWSKYMKGSDGYWYENVNAEYGMEMSSMDQNFVADYSPSDISYFFEIEKMTASKAAATTAGGTTYSNGSAWGHAASTRFTANEPIKAGKYKVTIVGKARRSGGEDMGISYISGGTPNPTGAVVTWQNAGTENIEKVLEDVSIPACDGIAIVNNGTWNSTSYLDYVVLEKTGELDSYTVTVNEAENGSVTSDLTEAKFGDKVTLTVEPAEGYAAKEVKASYTKTTVTPATEEGAEDIVTTEEIDVPVADDYTFTMPQANVTVSATFEKAYAITINAENGTVTSDPAEQGFEGDKVTLTITPATGYDFKSVSAVDAEGNTVAIAEDNTFTMPASAVTVTAEFEEKVIMLETDMTSSFAALTNASNWCTPNTQFNDDGTPKAGTTAAAVGWAAPQVTTNTGETVACCEFYDVNGCAQTGDMLYQTVKGLAPGTYKIELYGAAAFTFGRGFGSMAFTGDLTTATNDAYAEGNKITEDTGVKLTATTSEGTYGDEIAIWYATNFNPDGPETVVIDGVEVGSNGEVKLAMTKTSQSTNWHIIQLKGVTATVNAKDALAAAVAAAEQAAEQDIPQAVKDEVAQTVADNNKLYDTAEEYQAAIDAINAATAKANKFAAASDYFNRMAEVLDKTNVYTQEAYDANYGTWKQAYDEGTLDEATMATLTGDKAYVRNDWGAAHNGTDYNLDNVLLSAWTIGGEQAADYTKSLYINTWSTEGNDGSFPNPFFEYWTGDGNSLGATNIQATMTGLEAGKAYTATVLARVYDTGTTPAEEGITLTVGDGDGIDVTNGETTVVGNAANNYTFHIGTFTATGNADDEGNLKITFNVGNGSNVSWFSFKDMMVEAVPEEYEIVAQAENGTAETDVTTATEGTTVNITLTPDEGFEFDELTVNTFTWSTDEETGEKVMDLGEEDIATTETETGYSFVMPAGNVTVIAIFKEKPTKNEPGEYKNTPLTKDMLKGWNGVDDYAKVNNENPYSESMDLPAEVTAGNTVYGTSTVDCYRYADITGATTMRINGTPGVQVRVLMNRAYQEDGQGPLTEKQVIIGEDGYVDVDLSELEYVHVNAIKTGWGSSAGTIESIILNPFDPTAYTVESFCGSYYEGIPVEVDIDAIYQLIGAVPPGIKVVAEYPDGTRADNVRGDTDGWRDAEGNAKGWSTDAYFYLQDDPENANIFFMGGYPGNTEEPAEYTGTLVFINTATNAEQKVTFTLKYVPVPPVERNIVATIVKSVDYTAEEGDYTMKTVELTEDEIAEITQTLGFKTLGDESLEIYGYNPSDGSFVANWQPFDGWRNADGDFANWTGNPKSPVSVKILEDGLAVADGKFHTYNINGGVDVVKTYWAYANETDAVLVEIDVNFPQGYNVDIAETANGTVEADYTRVAEGKTVKLTVTPDEGYNLKSIRAFYTQEDGTEETGAGVKLSGMAMAAATDIDLELTQNEDGTYSFTMPAADVKVEAVFDDPTSIGAEDNSTGWWQDFSDFYNLTKGQTAFISFDNYNDGGENWHNWLYVTQKPNIGKYGAGDDEFGAIRADNYGWGSSYDATTLQNNYDWSTFMTDMNNSHVEATLGMDEEGKIVMNSVITTTEGKTYNYSYTSKPVDEDGFEFFYTVENAHLKNFKVTIEDVPVGINRINTDANSFATNLDEALRNGKVFDISGRKVSTVVNGGIYIVDGKKLIIRK